MPNMNKEKENDTNKQRNKKMFEIFQFVDKLRLEKKLKLSEKEFNKELLLFFDITDFRVVASKTKLMETLDLIEVHQIEWGEKEVWINEKH